MPGHTGTMATTEPGPHPPAPFALGHEEGEELVMLETTLVSLCQYFWAICKSAWGKKLTKL